MSEVEPTFGLVVIEPRLDSELLTERGVSTNDSDYDETGPQPGRAVPLLTDSEWSPVVVGEQEVGVELRVLRPGYPGRDGASVAWRLATETSDEDYRGWDDPVLITGVTIPDADAFPGSGDPWASLAVAAIPGLEEVMVLAVEAGTGGQQAYVWGYVPETESWRVSRTDLASSFDGLGEPVAMAWDPETERMMIWSCPGGAGPDTHYIALRSTNEFVEAFRQYSVGWAPADAQFGAADDHISVAVQPNRDWLMIAYEDGGDTYQLASSDRGASWEHVGGTHTAATISAAGSYHRVVAVPGRGYLVTYLDGSGGPHGRLLPTARTPFDDAAEIEIDGTTTADSLEPCVDSDGVIYVIYRDGTANEDAVVRIARSLDGGQSWQLYQYRVASSGEQASTNGPVLYGADAAGGQLHLLASDGSSGWSLTQLGGWSTVEHSGGHRLERVAWGGEDSVGPSADPAISFWWHGHYPDSTGWTAAVGAITVSSHHRGLQLTSAAATGGYTSPTTTTDRIQVIGWILLDLAAGEVRAGGTAGVGYALRCSDNVTGSNGYEIECRVYTDGIIIRDTIGATNLANVALSLLDQPIHIRAMIEGQLGADGICDVWYRLEGAAKWVRLVDGASVTRSVGGIPNAYMRWGILDANTSTVHVRGAGFAPGSWLSGLQANTALYEGWRGLQHGKPLPADRGYPCPGLMTASARQFGGQLRGGGLAGGSDQVDILPSYRYGIDQAWPGISPSPRQQWRSGSTDRVELVWDWGESPTGGGAQSGRWLGSVVALIVRAAAPRQWQLEVNDGGWVSLGTLDLALGTGLSWSLPSGQVTLTPASGTAEIGRYIHEGELVGGWFETAAGAVSGPIAANTGGYWTDRSDVQQIRIELEDDGGIGTSGSDGILCAPSGVVLLQGLPAGDATRYVRVVIPASQQSPHGDYRAGVIAVGRVMGVGAEPGWSWRRTVEYTREVSRRADQLMEVRELGPARTVLSYDWPDGAVLRELHVLGTRTRAVAWPGGEAIGTGEDVHSAITQVIAGQLQQGRVPCVVIPRLPQLGVTLTDPHRWLYGRVRSDSHGITGVLGTEGIDDIVRVDGITVESLE